MVTSQLERCGSFALLVFLLIPAWLCGQASTVERVGQAPASTAQEGVQYLSNGRVKLGIDLAMGGSVTYLADLKDGRNIVNSFDLGREIQMSFYNGPSPYVPDNEHQPDPRWAELGWNATMAGDATGNNSRILEFQRTESEMYVKLVPMQWALENYPSEYTFESRYRIEGNTVEVWCRLNNASTDKAQYAAREQEIPAVYVNSPWYRAMAYTGDETFTGQPVMEFPRRRAMPGQYPTTRARATEHWVALLDSNARGIGIWNPEVSTCLVGTGGIFGRGGLGDSPSRYLAFTRREVLDRNISYEYEYVIIVGNLTEIRDHVYRQRREPTYDFQFSETREGWWYENAVDTGWLVTGQLTVTPTVPGAALNSPPLTWDGNTVSAVEIDADFGVDGGIQVFWSTLEEDSFHASRMVPVVVRPGRERIRVPLTVDTMIVGLRIASTNAPGQSVTVHSIRAVRS